MKRTVSMIFVALLALIITLASCDQIGSLQQSGSTSQTTGAVMGESGDQPLPEDTNAPEEFDTNGAYIPDDGKRPESDTEQPVETQATPPTSITPGHGFTPVDPSVTEQQTEQPVETEPSTDTVGPGGTEPAPHDHAFGSWTTVREATCSDQGEQRRYCDCGEYQSQAIGTVDHVLGEVIEEVIYAPDCWSRGESYMVTYCATCGIELGRDTVWVDALGHTEVIDPAVEATCITDGKTQGSHCSVCQQTLTWQETIYATGVHVYVDEVCKYCSVKIVYSEGLKFTSNGDGTCYVSGIGSCTDRNIIIPRISPDGDVVTRIGEFPFTTNYNIRSVSIPDTVTEISERAFYKSYSLTSVNIPDSVTSIGYEAFGDTSITSIVIPNSVTNIGDNAFYGCNDLKSVTLPDGITSIGTKVFYGCNDLQSITIPDTVTKIGEEAFYACSGLTEITIPVNVTSIGIHAFSLCKSLESMTVARGNPVYHSYGNCLIETASKTLIAGCKTSTIPANGSVTSIGDYAFYSCTGLTEITIPNCITSIGTAAFEDCKYLTGISIPDSVISIGDCAFAGCTKFTEVIIPDSVKNIGIDAFNNCYNMESVTIGKGVTSIGEYAFYDCDSLTAVYIKDIAAWCTISFGDNVGANPLEEAGNLYLNGELVTDLVIPDGTPYISDCAFYECTCLTSVIIPGSVVYIGEEAFYDCTALTSVTMKNGIRRIENSAFSSCEGLTDVSIPNSVTYVGDYAFSWCSGLVNVSIPGSITHLGKSAFNKCTELTYNEYEGVKYLGNSQNPYVVLIAPNDTNQATYTVHKNTKIIYQDAFKNCTSLTSITLPEGLVGICGSAFYGCRSLTEINIPNSVTYIGDSAFYNCYNLTSIVLPHGLTSIGSSAFYQCSSLESINLPDTLTYIGGYAFYDCYNLYIDIVIPEGVTAIYPYSFYHSIITSVVIPDSVTSIGERAFYNCYGLESVTMGKGVTEIGKLAFYYCHRVERVYITDLAAWCEISFGDQYSNPLGYYGNLFLNGELITDLIIPDDVTGIHNYAFYGCDHFASITIPDSVESIGEYAFSRGSGVKVDDYVSDILNVSIGNGVKSIGDYAFYNTVMTSINIPDSVTTIGAYAFSNTNLQSVTIPDSVELIGNYAFFGTCLTEVSIPGSVKTIGDSAFQSCYQLIRVTLGDGVESIGEGVFYGCERLVSINIPASVTRIGEEAFRGCLSLACEIVIPDGVTVIEERTFYGCRSIPRIVIGRGVTKIVNGAFDGCNSWSGTVIIPASVQSIGRNAFAGCKKIEYMIIEKGELVKIEHSYFGEEIDELVCFNRIYYTGTAEDWANITVEIFENDYAWLYPVFDLTPYFYSATAPEDKGNYWYYNDDGEIKVWNLAEVSYKAEEYSEKFANAAFGESTDSYSSQFLAELKKDMQFQAQVVIWEGLHIATDTSWESKMISKKDTYKIVIYDLLVGEVGSEVNPLAFMEIACDSYLYEFAKFFLTDDSLKTVDELKGLDPKNFDYETFSDYYFGSVDGIHEIFDEATDLYDALYVCAQYQVLSDMDEYFYDMLMYISADATLPRDLRDAARECASCYGNATEEMLQQVLLQEFVSNKVEDIWNKLEEKLWNKILTSAFPGVEVIQLGLRGVMFLVNGGFNLDAINEAYYQLEAAVGLEKALRRIIKDDLLDYYRYELISESEYYMYAIDKYKMSVLLGYDYSDALLKELYKGGSASEKVDYAEQMEEIAAQKLEKRELYNQFDATISQAYANYYR